MPKCKFCGKVFDESVGVLYVKKDGSKAALNYYCSKKCEKNMNMRKSRDVRWTETYRQDKEERLRLQSQS